MATANIKITRALIEHIISEIRLSDIGRMRNHVQELTARNGADSASTSFGFNLHYVPQDVYDTFSEPEVSSCETRWKVIHVGDVELTLFVHRDRD
jgi:hypothetical protein